MSSATEPGKLLRDMTDTQIYLGLAGVLTGFVAATFGRYIVDIWIDHTRRARDAKQLARLLVAEIRAAKGLVMLQISIIRADLDEGGSDEPLGGLALQSMKPPSLGIYHASIQKLGLLPGDVAERTVCACSVLVHLGRLTELNTTLADAGRVLSSDMRDYVHALEGWLDEADRADSALSQVAGVPAQAVPAEYRSEQADH